MADPSITWRHCRMKLCTRRRNLVSQLNPLTVLRRVFYENHLQRLKYLYRQQKGGVKIWVSIRDYLIFFYLLTSFEGENFDDFFVQRGIRVSLKVGTEDSIVYISIAISGYVHHFGGGKLILMGAFWPFSPWLLKISHSKKKLFYYNKASQAEKKKKQRK